MAQGSSSNQTYEFRCPVHGFIKVNHWERDVIDHPAFQRLRRIRQLGWTDYVYPGGTHGNPDIQVATDNSEEVRPLSDYSPVIKQLIATPHRQVRLYSRREVAGRAKQIINDEARRSS